MAVYEYVAWGMLFLCLVVLGSELSSIGKIEKKKVTYGSVVTTLFALLVWVLVILKI
jgi:hypothetical protein